MQAGRSATAAQRRAPERIPAGFHEAAARPRDLQQEQALARVREEDRKPRPQAAPPAPVIIYDEYICRRLGPRVWEDGDEIRFRTRRKRPPTEEQINAILTGAIEKGWGVLYVYDRAGEPAMQMISILQQAIAARGLQGQIQCCTDPEELKTLWAKKKELRAARYAPRDDFTQAAQLSPPLPEISENRNSGPVASALPVAGFAIPPAPQPATA